MSHVSFISGGGGKIWRMFEALDVFNKTSGLFPAKTSSSLNSDLVVVVPKPKKRSFRSAETHIANIHSADQVAKDAKKGSFDFP